MTGDKFDINVVDLWSSSSPWPLCNMPKSYFFLVKHPWLWRMSFRCSEPELLHEAMFTVRDFSHLHSASLRALASCVHVLLAHILFHRLDTHTTRLPRVNTFRDTQQSLAEDLRRRFKSIRQT